MNIKSQTIIDYALFRKYFIFKKLRSKTFTFFIILNLVWFLATFIIIYFDVANLITDIVLLLLQTLFITIYLVFNFFRLESTFNYESSNIGQIINYHFTDDHIKVYYEKNKSEGFVLVKYEDLAKIYEFSNHIFIVTSSLVTYVVTKGSYDGGDDKTLMEFFGKIIGLQIKKVRI